MNGKPRHRLATITAPIAVSGEASQARGAGSRPRPTSSGFSIPKGLW